MAKLNTNGGSAATQKEILGFVDEAQDTMEGFEQITQRTMAIPFIRLLQQLSPQVNKKEENDYIEGAEEGIFINTISKELLGDHIDVIPLKFEQMYIEWRPDRQGLAGYHSPEHAEEIAVDKTFGSWKTKDGNTLSETYVYMCLIEGREKEGIVVLSMSSSAIKVARTWNRLLTTMRTPSGKLTRPYHQVWTVSAEYVSNDKGKWYRPKVTFSHFVKEQQYLLAVQERKTLPPSRNLDLKQIRSDASEGGVGTTEY